MWVAHLVSYLRYIACMPDAGSQMVVMLAGAFAVPVLTWPVERTRVVVVAWPAEPDIALEPEPEPADPMAELDCAILDHLADDPGASIREIAAAVQAPRTVVHRRVVAMRAGSCPFKLAGVVAARR